MIRNAQFANNLTGFENCWLPILCRWDVKQCDSAASLLYSATESRSSSIHVQFASTTAQHIFPDKYVKLAANKIRWRWLNLRKWVILKHANLLVKKFLHFFFLSRARANFTGSKSEIGRRWKGVPKCKSGSHCILSGMKSSSSVRLKQTLCDKQRTEQRYGVLCMSTAVCICTISVSLFEHRSAKHYLTDWNEAVQSIAQLQGNSLIPLIYGLIGETTSASIQASNQRLQRRLFTCWSILL